MEFIAETTESTEIPADSHHTFKREDEIMFVVDDNVTLSLDSRHQGVGNLASCTTAG